MSKDQQFILGLTAIAAITFVAVYAIERNKQIRLSNPLMSLEVA